MTEISISMQLTRPLMLAQESLHHAVLKLERLKRPYIARKFQDNTTLAFLSSCGQMDPLQYMIMQLTRVTTLTILSALSTNKLLVASTKATKIFKRFVKSRKISSTQLSIIWTEWSI